MRRICPLTCSPGRPAAQAIAICRLKVACPGWHWAHIASKLRRCRSDVVYGSPIACLTSSRLAMYAAKPLTSPVTAAPSAARYQRSPGSIAACWSRRRRGSASQNRSRGGPRLGTSSGVSFSSILVANDARNTRIPRPVSPSGAVPVRANAAADT
jgi:hypothetical protein